MKTQEFHLGSILTVITGRLVDPSGMEGVYKILNFMTGDNLFTHQLPRAAAFCKPALVEQYPHLDLVPFTDQDANRVEAWLADQVAIYGERLSVRAVDGWERMNPISELVTMTGGRKPVIICQAD